MVLTGQHTCYMEKGGFLFPFRQQVDEPVDPPHLVHSLVLLQKAKHCQTLDNIVYSRTLVVKGGLPWENQGGLGRLD